MTSETRPECRPCRPPSPASSSWAPASAASPPPGTRARTGRDRRHRSPQLPPVPAAALSGRDGGAVAGRHRLADPRDPRPAGQRVGADGQGRGRRRRTPRGDPRGPPGRLSTISSLATGARHSYFGHDEWEHVRAGLKKIADATAYPRADPARVRARRDRPRPGRAPAAADFRRRRRRADRASRWRVPWPNSRGMRWPPISATSIPRDARVVLVEGGPRVLPTFPASSVAKGARAAASARRGGPARRAGDALRCAMG